MLSKDLQRIIKSEIDESLTLPVLTAEYGLWFANPMRLYDGLIPVLKEK